MTNLDSILKSRDITLPTKVHLVKAMVFPVVMYGCESWAIKKAKCRRIDAFELWCWRRLLRVRWTARRSNQSILKEISTECSLEGLMLKLKRQYFGHLMWRTGSFEKTLMLRKIEGRRRGRQRMRWTEDATEMASPTQWTWVWVNSGSWWWTGRLGMLQSMGSQNVGHDWVTEPNTCKIHSSHPPNFYPIPPSKSKLSSEYHLDQLWVRLKNNSSWCTIPLHLWTYLLLLRLGPSVVSEHLVPNYNGGTDIS